MNTALILSGGVGLRLGADIPKQYIEVNGKTILSYCLEAVSASPAVDAIQIVADRKWQDRILSWLDETGAGQKFRGFSLPGENRQLSILSGLEDICRYAKETDYVMVHDAVRPFVSKELMEGCFAAARRHDGALPVLAMKDTVYRSRDGQKITSLLERNELFAGQAPEVFVLGKYLEANRSLLPERIRHINGSSEPAVLAGMDIALVPGDQGNFKITTEEDLERFRQSLNTFA